MKNLQEIINEKARKRAFVDAKIIIDAFSTNNVHSVLDDQKFAFIVTIKDGKEEKQSIRSAFWGINSEVPKHIIDKLTEKYIPEE